MHEELVEKGVVVVLAHVGRAVRLLQADVLAARVDDDRSMQVDEVVVRVIVRSRRVDSLPGASVFGLESFCVILLGTSILMHGAPTEDEPFMDGLVIHAGLVISRPRPAGPRTGEGGL